MCVCVCVCDNVFYIKVDSLCTMKNLVLNKQIKRTNRGVSVV